MACTNFVVYQTDDESETKGRFVELKTNGEEKKGNFSLDIDIFMTLFAEN